MIDFACKKFDLTEIIKCSLNLTIFEFDLLEFLIKNDKKWLSAKDISKKLNVGLSTAQKGVKKLSEKNILLLNQKNISGGGYYFVYKIANKQRIRKNILAIVHNWVKNVELKINNW